MAVGTCVVQIVQLYLITGRNTEPFGASINRISIRISRGLSVNNH